MEARERTITVQVEIGKRGFGAALVLLLLCLQPVELATEQLTLTTYYPAPFGNYVRLRTTRDSYLAYSGGSVGIRTVTPSSGYKLDVNGKAVIQGNVEVRQMASVANNVTAAGRSVTLGDVGGFHLSSTGNLVLGSQTGAVRIGAGANEDNYYLGDMCQYEAYDSGKRDCSFTGWSPVAFTDGGRKMHDNISLQGSLGPILDDPGPGNQVVVPGNQMLCCKLESF
ncbi:MAG: hypothetical protein ABII00_19155 [Elusimicrobiota bacterium]